MLTQTLRSLERDGVYLHLEVEPRIVEVIGQAKRVGYDGKDRRGQAPADLLLAAVGRRPDVEGLDLEAAGVAA